MDSTPTKKKSYTKKTLPKTIKMVRDEMYPEPHTANVHIDEVGAWKAKGWVEA